MQKAIEVQPSLPMRPILALLHLTPVAPMDVNQYMRIYIYGEYLQVEQNLMSIASVRIPQDKGYRLALVVIEDE